MRHLNKIILLIFIVIGSILRIYNIGFQNMGTEEIYTLNIVKMPIFNIITNFDYTPPVYNLLAHFSYVLFGGYDVAIRYTAVIAGILLIPAAFYLGKEYHSEIIGIILCGAYCDISSDDLLFPIRARIFTIFIVFRNCTYSIFKDERWRQPFRYQTRILDNGCGESICSSLYINTTVSDVFRPLI